MNKKKQIIISLIIGLLVIFLGLFFYFKNEINKSLTETKNDLEKQEITNYYINEKGQKWFLANEGKVDFQVVSQNKYPKFIRGFIDPLKVGLGDIQKMEVVVQAIERPKNVWAEIQHDNGYDKVELKLIKEEVLTKKEDLPVVVDENGKVVLRNEKENKFNLILEKMFEKALAENVKEYTYYGEWKVHSTQTKKYHTIFYVEDLKGVQDKMVLAWSDPCTFSGNSVSRDCTLSDVDGVDAADIEFGWRYNVTINPGGLFVFNPGKSINLLDNGRFILNGGQIKEGYLYYQDNDGDGYVNNLANSVSEKIYKTVPGDSNGRLVEGSNIFIRESRKNSAIFEVSSYPASATTSAFKIDKFFVKRNNGLFDFLFKKANAYLICDEGEIINDDGSVIICYHSPPPPAGGLVPWSSLNNLYASDGNSASTEILNNNNYSLWLKVSNFNFSSIPDYALIKDIAVEVKASKSNSAANVSLIGALYVGSNMSFEKSLSINSTSLVVYTFSSSTKNLNNNVYKWSFLPSVSEIKNSSNFGFYLKAKSNDTNNTIVNVDYVKIKVTYEITGIVTTTLADCIDNDQRAYPGQIKFFPEGRDFNCDNNIEFDISNTSNMSCTSIASPGYNNIFGKLFNSFFRKVFSYISPYKCNDGVVGWDPSSSPFDQHDCGSTFIYVSGCDRCDDDSTLRSGSRVVYCR